MAIAETTVPGQSGLPCPNPTKSFWHSEPSKILLGHRTTAELPSKTDVVIIGSGISGVCAAHYLREDARGKGLNVVMLEAREACWGATGRNGGHCQPLLYEAPPDVGAFELRNYFTLKKLVEEHNIPCDWQTLTGVHAYMSENMFNIGLERVKALEKIDLDLAGRITVVTKESESPSLTDLRIPSAAGAFIQTNAASLWPYKLVSWLLENLLAKNKQENPAFNLQTTTPVTRLQKMDESWIVYTERGMIEAKQVLLTTNAYTSYLLPEFCDLIVPVQGEMSSLIPPKAVTPSDHGQPLKHSYVFIGHGKQNIDQDDYLVQRPFSNVKSADLRGGQLMFGGGRSEALKSGLGVSDDSEIDPDAAAYLRRELNAVLDLENRNDELKASYQWTGIMGFSRDNRPWVGELSEDVRLGGGKGLWVSAGFTGHGMPNTCLSAKAVVQMMLGSEKEKVDLPFSYHVSKERATAARDTWSVEACDVHGMPRS